MRWTGRVLIILLAVVFAYFVITSVQVVTASRAPRAVGAAPKSSAIVVVGTAAGHTGVSIDVRARCSQAAALWHGHRSVHVVTTGGRPSAGEPVEATVLATCLVRNGVPQKDILQLPVSGVPAQLQAVAELYPASAHRHVLVVADPIETKWLLAVAAASGLSATASPAPAPKSGFWSSVGGIWNQAVAVGLGRIIGYQHTTWVSG